MNILYVEDDPLDADLVRRELRRSHPGAGIEIAPTLSEAHRLLADTSRSFDLILTDMRLPDGTGLELLEEIRKMHMPLAVIILTGTGDEQTAIAALKAGADDYITKRTGYHRNLMPTLEAAFERFSTESARRSRLLRVLYAEHNETDFDLTQRHLTRYAPHIELEMVYTAPEALHQIRQAIAGGKPYDVLLLDYQLAGMNALELLKVLYQEEQIDLPAVLVTGRGDEDAAAQALRLGAADYLVKSPGYLFRLPAMLENAYYAVQLEREHQRLAKSEQRFRLLAENARDVIYRLQLQPTPHFEYISPAVLTVTGYTPEDCYAASDALAHLVHPDDRGLMEQMIAQGNFEQPLIVRCVRKDGSTIWTEQRNVPVYAANGELAMLEGITRDITQNKAREQEILSKSALVRLLKDVSESANMADDVNEALQFAIDRICMELDWDIGHAFLWSDSIPERMVSLPVWYLRDPQKYEAFRAFTDTDFTIHAQGVVNRVIQSGQSEWIENVSNNDTFVRKEIAAQCGLHAGYIFPIFISQQPVGALEFYASSFKAPQQELIEAITSIGVLVGRVIERKRALNALQERETQFRLLAENSTDVISLHTLSGAIRYISPACARVVGYEPEELVGRTALEITHEGDKAEVATFFQRFKDNLNTHTILYRVLHKDGHFIWLETSARPIRTDPDTVEIHATSRDVTERESARTAEREQRILAEALRESAATLISAVDLKTVMTTILENVARVVPHDAANIMLIEGDKAHPVYWRGYEDHTTAPLSEFRISLEDSGSLRQMFVDKEPYLIPDTTVYYDWVHHPLTDWVKSHVSTPILSHGEVIGFLNLDSARKEFFNDQHAQRLRAFADQASLAIEHAQLYEEIQSHARELETRVAERTAELQQSQARYRAIIEDQTDLVCRYLPGGILTFVNQTYSQHLKRPLEELLGKSLFDFVAEPERTRLQEQIALLSRDNPVTTVELREVTAEGQERWFHWSEHMLFDDTGCFVEYQGVGRDITERKSAENQLQRMLEKSIELSELRSRYMSMAAHDLRNPLAVIKSSVDILQNYSAKLTDVQREMRFDNIHMTINVMVSMLDDFLVIGQVESGKFDFTPAPMDLVAFCRSLITEMREFTGTDLQIEFSSNQCGITEMDSRLLRHILSNLLSNAIKYSPENGVVKFSLDCENGLITFCIEDEGIGIPQEDQPQLFEPFFRASNAGRVPGTGLGLAIVKRSVDLHGGTISFRSEEGSGTSFTVVFSRD